MNKLDLLKLKKAILVASLTGMATLTGCQSNPEVKGAKRIEIFDLGPEKMYIDENGYTVIEVRPEIHYTESGIKYEPPAGFTLMYDNNNKIICRKVIEKTKGR